MYFTPPGLGWDSRDQVPELVNQKVAGTLKVDDFVTDVLPFDDVNKGFDIMHAGKG